MESDIQEIATHIGFMLGNFASRLVEKLPATLTREKELRVSYKPTAFRRWVVDHLPCEMVQTGFEKLEK